MAHLTQAGRHSVTPASHVAPRDARQIPRGQSVTASHAPYRGVTHVTPAVVGARSLLICDTDQGHGNEPEVCWFWLEPGQ